MTFILTWIATAIAIWFATALVGGINIDGGWTTYMWVALIFGLINATLGLLLKIITFPLSILTFGLFLIVINAAMLELTASLIDSLTIDNFWDALLASVIISIVSTLTNAIFNSARESGGSNNATTGV